MSVQSAGLNLNSNYLNTGMFGANALAPFGGSNYEDDLMMPEYLKMSSLNSQTAAQSQNSAQSVFTANPQKTQTEQTQISQPQVATSSETEETQPEPKKFNVFKILGGILGAGVPILTAASTKTFSKKLLIKAPLLAVAGYAIGALIDGIFNSSKNTKEAPPA